MTEGIGSYISSLNWSYKVTLRENGIIYHNALAKFLDNHTVEATFKNNKKKIFSSRRFLIAVGGRPFYPSIPGAEFAISSDDLFSLSSPPGKTLVIGASCLFFLFLFLFILFIYLFIYLFYYYFIIILLLFYFQFFIL